MKFDSPEGWEEIRTGVWVSPVEEHTFTEDEMKEIAQKLNFDKKIAQKLKFDHDNEGKAPLSPHAAMARLAVEKAQRGVRDVPEVIASDLCPPGKAYIMDPEALGLEGERKVVVVSNDETKRLLEDAIADGGDKSTKDDAEG